VTTSTGTTFLVLLSFISLAGTAALAIGAVAWRVLAPVDERAPWLAAARADVGAVAVRLAALVAGTATLGSLWYSEGVGYVPCALCWGQRIFMYSLAVVLVVGALRRDAGVRAYGLALAIPGAALAAYHAWLQKWGTSSTFCSLEAPCTERHVWEFGFVSIPFMALTGFLFVIALLLASTPRPDGSDTTPADTEPMETHA
jgi:disulfide bond formation protein DsbB